MRLATALIMGSWLPRPPTPAGCSLSVGAPMTRDDRSSLRLLHCIAKKYVAAHQCHCASLRWGTRVFRAQYIAKQQISRFAKALQVAMKTFTLRSKSHGAAIAGT